MPKIGGGVCVVWFRGILVKLTTVGYTDLTWARNREVENWGDGVDCRVNSVADGEWSCVRCVSVWNPFTTND